MFKNSPILATFCHLLEITRLITTRVINLHFLTVSKNHPVVVESAIDTKLLPVMTVFILLSSCVTKLVCDILVHDMFG